MKFSATLVRPAGTGTLTYFVLPAELTCDVEASEQISVRGSVNGISMRSKAIPNGAGERFVVLNKTMRDELGVTVGDTVEVSMELDQIG